MTKRLIVGAHVSSAGKLSKAIDRAKAIGAECVQIFYGPPVAWAQPKYEPALMEEFRANAARHKIGPAFVHAMYLINLASENVAARKRSIRTLAATLRFAEALGAAGVVLHPGSHQGRGFEKALPVLAKALRAVITEAPGVCPVLIEGASGQGGAVGRTFEELAGILNVAGHPKRFGICLDLAHVHGAGYDIISEAGIRKTFQEFGRIVGWERLGVIHANDSKVERGSSVDRHENIGAGRIGTAAFRRLVRHPQLRRVPWVLEVPGEGEGPDRANVMRLRRLSLF